MNKEEILAKSRKENTVADERTQYIELKGANFSISVMIILWIILTRFTPLDDITQYAMGLLVTTTSFSNFAYQLAKNRTKTTIFFCLLFFIAAVIYLILFLRLGLKLF